MGLSRIFASGLRNPAGLDFEPRTGALRAIVDERDEIGPNLDPDYRTSAREGALHGWPDSDDGQHVGPCREPQRPDLVATAVEPDDALSSHLAPLGLAVSRSEALPPECRGGAFVGEHGSWDRRDLGGDKLVPVPFAHGRPRAAARDGPWASPSTRAAHASSRTTSATPRGA